MDIEPTLAAVGVRLRTAELLCLPPVAHDDLRTPKNNAVIGD